MPWSAEVESAVAKRLAALDRDPWFRSLDDAGRCEAMTIAALLALEDVRDRARATRPAPQPIFPLAD